MKKFQIHNNLSGLDFVQYADTLVMHPEYGKPDRWIATVLLSTDEASRVMSTRAAATMSDPNATESLLAAEFTVITTDMTQAIHDQKMVAIRAKRNTLLTACDYTQLVDSPLDSPTKQAWRDYRQALRTLPDTVTDVDNVTWPTPPAAVS